MNKRQKQLQKAAEVANRHADLHPWEVAMAACNSGPKADYEAFLVGLLHDSVEDEYISEEELALFPDDVRDAVYVLSRKDGEKYWDYIARVKQASALARKVKLADAQINLDRCRQSFGFGGLEKRYVRVIEELT